MRERRLLIAAIWQLLVARVRIAVIPFPRIARQLGGFVAPHNAASRGPSHAANERERAIAREIGWAVTRAARHIPFEAVCLPQALAAHALLRKRGIFGTIHFGTARGVAFSLQAHAWLDAAGVEVTGYPVGSEFIEIACLAPNDFASEGLKSEL